MKIEKDVALALFNGVVTGNKFVLSGQLDRQTYLAVDKVLRSLGGKWSRKEQGHIFDHDPTEDIFNVASSGEFVNVKKEIQFFETPLELSEAYYYELKKNYQDCILVICNDQECYTYGQDVIILKEVLSYQGVAFGYSEDDSELSFMLRDFNRVAELALQSGEVIAIAEKC